MDEGGGNARPPIEDVSAADQILDLVARGHDECPVFCPELSTALKRRGASPLGISSGHQVANDAKTGSGTTGKSRNQGLLGRIGWGTWIRTKINGVRVRRSTVELFPSSGTRLARPVGEAGL